MNEISRLRIARAQALADALAAADPNDAAALCAAFLEDASPPAPWADPFGEAEADARLWATASPVHQIVAVTVAGLAVLPDRAIPPRALKQALVGLWHKLGERDRLAFVARIDPTGQFTGGRVDG